MPPFQDFDLAEFWDESDEDYTLPPASDELIASVEEELGYTLPNSYKVLMEKQNGGFPKNTCFPTTEPTSWAEDHVAINNIIGIGRDQSDSLCGDSGSQFMIDEWGYPAYGVYVCDCPSAGHDMILLDYRKCGPEGEPEVVHVDQEFDYKITFLAKDFETFVRGLVHDDIYAEAEASLQEKLQIINEGGYSAELALLMAHYHTINFNDIIRNICRQLTIDTGSFSFQDNELSYLMFDIQFLLYKNLVGKVKKDDFLNYYPRFIAYADAEFKTSFHSPMYVTEWLETRLKEKNIQKNFLGHLKFKETYAEALLERIKKYA